jgi:hypothetical protein
MELLFSRVIPIPSCLSLDGRLVSAAPDYSVWHLGSQDQPAGWESALRSVVGRTVFCRQNVAELGLCHGRTR